MQVPLKNYISFGNTVSEFPVALIKAEALASAPDTGCTILSLRPAEVDYFHNSGQLFIPILYELTKLYALPLSH